MTVTKTAQPVSKRILKFYSAPLELGRYQVARWQALVIAFICSVGLAAGIEFLTSTFRHQQFKWTDVAFGAANMCWYAFFVIHFNAWFSKYTRETKLPAQIETPYTRNEKLVLLVAVLPLLAILIFSIVVPR